MDKINKWNWGFSPNNDLAKANKQIEFFIPRPKGTGQIIEQLNLMTLPGGAEGSPLTLVAKLLIQFVNLITLFSLALIFYK